MAGNRQLRIALIQHHCQPDSKENLALGVEALRQAASEGAQVVAFPELSFLRFFPQHPRNATSAPEVETVPGPTTSLFCQLAKELEVVVILNLYEQEGQHFYDSSPVIDADGSLLGVARMVHIMEGTCFHEQDYYHPGNRGAAVFQSRFGRIGVAICYDRHYPEYMRALGLKRAELVVVPQAGAVDEWPAGLFEGELQVASLQNGYFSALANRVGVEECLTFAGESFVTDPFGQVIARAPAGKEAVLYADLDFDLLEDCPARRHFLEDRRPDIYPL